MTDEELRAAIIAEEQRRSGGGGAATRAYRAVAEPVTQAVAAVAGPQSGDEAGVTALLERWGAAPAEAASESQKLGAATRNANRATAEAIVPQTPMQAGMMAGTLAAGPLVNLAARTGLPVALLQARPALARVLAAALGGEVGGELQGETPGKGALIGGGTTAAGELASAGVSKVLRSLPGAKGRIANADAERFAEAIGDVAPPLRGIPTQPDLPQGVPMAERLRSMASGPGRDALGEAKEGAVGVIERLIGGQPIEVPALGGSVSVRDANRMLSEIGARAFSRNPLDRTVNGVDQRQLYGQVADQIRTGIATAEAAYRRGAGSAAQTMAASGRRLALPPASGPSVQPSSPGGFEARGLTQREGVERTLEAAGAGGAYREAPSTVIQPRSSTRTLQAQRTEEAAPPGTTALVPYNPPMPGPSAAQALWDAAQGNYKRGLAVLKLLENPGAYRGYANEVQLNTPALQRTIGAPKGEAGLTVKLGGEGSDEALLTDLFGELADRPAVQRIADALLRGGRLGMRDELADVPLWTKLGAGSALGLGGGVAAGGPVGALAAALPFLLPNVRSRYVGRAPYTAPENLRTILDLVLQRAGAEGLEPRR